MRLFFRSGVLLFNLRFTLFSARLTDLPSPSGRPDAVKEARVEAAELLPGQLGSPVIGAVVAGVPGAAAGVVSVTKKDTAALCG